MVSIISVSVDDKQRDWLQSQRGRRDCSPTFLLRRAIHEKMQEMGDEYFNDIKTMRKRLESFQAMQADLRSFIERKGLIDEFLEKKEG